MAINDKKKSALGYLADETLKLNQKLGQDVINTLAPTGGPVDTLINKGISGLGSGAYDTLKSSIADIKEVGAPIGAAIMGGREGLAALEAQDKTPAATLGGETTMKSQGSEGMGGAGANLSGLKDFNMTQNQAVGSAEAPGLGVTGDTMNYRSPTGGTATITGPGIGSKNFDLERINKGVPTIGDWANQEAKQSMHEAGMNRLRAGLPYDAKEAAGVKSQMAAAKAREYADLNFSLAQQAQQKEANRISQDLQNQASWMTRGSNVGSRQRKEAAELYAAAAGIEGGALKEGMQNRNVRELGLGQIDQNAADSLRDYEAALAGNQATAQNAMLKNMIEQGNADRTYNLEREKLGTERQKAGLTAQEKQGEAINRAQKLRLEAADKSSAIWANPNITSMQDKRRLALGMYQQSGMAPKEAQFEVLQTDPEARDAIARKDWNSLNAMYDKDVVDIYRDMLLKRQQAYPQK